MSVKEHTNKYPLLEILDLVVAEITDMCVVLGSVGLPQQFLSLRRMMITPTLLGRANLLGTALRQTVLSEQYAQPMHFREVHLGQEHL
jgi:hypothetical protein